MSAPQPITVLACPHPFRAQQTTLAGLEGETIEQILARVQPRPELRRHAHVFLGDGYVPPQYWHAVRPRAGVTLTVRMVPSGGGGGQKDPLRTVLTIAVIAASMVVSGPAGAAYFGSPTGAALAGVAVGMAGMALVNQIAPPFKPERSATSDDQSQTYSITGGRNVLAPWAPVPMVLGRHRITPPLAARPYTEISGDDQYLRQLFLIGYGPLNLTEFRIGETLIDSDPATAEANYQEAYVKPVAGNSGDGVPEGFTADVYEEQFSVLLEQVGGWQTRTTQPNTDELSLDISFPMGLVTFASDGSKATTAVEVEAEYALTGTGAWKKISPGTEHAQQNVHFSSYIGGFGDPDQSRSVIHRIVIDRDSGQISVLQGAATTGTPVPPAVPSNKLKICQFDPSTSRPVPVDERDAVLTATDPAAFAPAQSAEHFHVQIGAGLLSTSSRFTTSDASTAAQRRGARLRVARGQYDVRLRRVTADATSDQVLDTVYWTALRSITDQSPVALDNVASASLHIKATDQLNGTVDQFNCLAELVAPDWDTDTQTWITRGTSNPASLYRWILQGPASKSPVSDSKLDLITLQEWHTWCAQNGKEFNAVIDSKRTRREMLDMVCAAGRASYTKRDGLYSVVIDQPRSVIAQHFTPRNSRNYHGAKIFTRQPHGLRIRYVDRDQGWRQAERIVYADGYSEANATTFEDLELFGVTSADQVWKDGRYHLAVLQLRPEQHTFELDIEHLRCTRGDLIRFAHDVPLLGIVTGRVKRVIANGAPTADTTHLHADTTFLRVNEEGLILQLDQLIPMETGVSYGIRFRLSDGSSVVYTVHTVAGEMPIIRCDTGAVGTPPAAGDLFMFGAQGAESVELLVTKVEPLADQGARVTAVDYAPAVYTADTSAIPPYDPQITVPPELRVPDPPVVDRIRSDESVLIRNNDGSLTTRGLITLGRRPALAAITPLRTEVQIRPAGVGAFVAAATTGTESTEISITDVQDGVTYDIRLKYQTLAGKTSSWTTITHTVVGKTSNPPAISALYFEAPYAVWRYTSPPLDWKGFVLRYHAGNRTTWSDAAPAHDGVVTETKFDTSVIAAGGTITLLAKAVDIVGNESDTAAVLIMNLGDPVVENIILTQDEKSAGWTGDIVNGGVLLGNLVADASSVFWAGIGTTPFWTGTGSSTFWATSYKEMTYTATYSPATAEVGATLTLSTTIAGDGWFIDYRIGTGPWKPWPGRLTVENVTYEIRITTLAGSTQGAISQCTLNVDVPDVVETFENVSLAATTGTRLTLTNTYTTIVNVSGITIQGTTTALKVIVVDKNPTSGPLLQAIDSTGAVVAATVDVARVQGY